MNPGTGGNHFPSDDDIMANDQMRFGNMGAHSPGYDGKNHLDLMDTYHANGYDMDDEFRNYRGKKWSGDTRDTSDLDGADVMAS